MMKIAFAVATGATAAQSRARSAVAIKRFAQVSSKLTGLGLHKPSFCRTPVAEPA
jgi:hypothetical protein